MVALLRITFGGPGDADLAGVLVIAVAYVGTLIVLARRQPFNYLVVTMVDAVFTVAGLAVMSFDAGRSSTPLGNAAGVLILTIAWLIAVAVLYVFLRAMSQLYERNGRE